MGEKETFIKKADMSKEFQDCMSFYDKQYYYDTISNYYDNKTKNIQCKMVKRITCEKRIHYEDSEEVQCNFSWNESIEAFKINIHHIENAESLVTVPNFKSGESDLLGYLRCTIKDPKYYDRYHIEEPFVLRINVKEVMRISMSSMYVLGCSLVILVLVSIFLCYLKRKITRKTKCKP